MQQEADKEISWRSYLAASAASAALLAAGALSVPVTAMTDKGAEKGGTLYGHGMVWNRALPGVAGDLDLSFDLRLNLELGTGLGTAEDPVHPDWDLHFDIHSVQSEKRPRGETRLDMNGVVTQAANPTNVGMPIRMLAETVGETTGIAIAIGDLAFGGAGIVVKEPGQYDGILITLIRIILGR